MSGWEYACPECGVHVVSGWADPVCPNPRCGAALTLLRSPEPTPEDVERVLAEAESALRRAV